MRVFILMSGTYKHRFNRKHGQKLNQPNSLEDISRLSGYELKGLKTIFSKGKGAFKRSHSSVRPSVKSPEAWAFARTYAAVNPKSKAHKVDKVHLKKK